MKYFNIKRYKFSTIVKNFNTLGRNFLPIFKFIVRSFNTLGHNFLQIFQFIDFKKIYNYLDVTRFDFKKITKYLNPKIYNINYIKKINFISHKFLILHLPATIIFFGFLYLVIPTFYNYDKSNVTNVICKNNNIECIIKGEVGYSFYPTPRLKIKDLIINEVSQENTLATIEDVSIKLSIKNLLAEEKHKFKKIELNTFKTNLDLKNFKKYKNILRKKINLVPTTFKKGQIIFNEGNNYVASITDANIKAKFIQGYIEAELKGKFLNDDIYINLNNKNVDDKVFTDLILKMSNLNLLTKANFFNSAKEENTTSGNFLIKKDKNKITGIFDYKDNELKISKSNLRNTFIDGKLEGKIIFLPYFNFNLDFNLNSINFTRLYNYFLALHEKKQKNLFVINNKINGKVNLAADKVYSKHNLVKSFESRIKFYNGNIKIEQFLINLGKLGAADILGTISNDKKFTNLKFESNVFVDNQKKFLSKFGIYDKESISSNLFISGNFDLKNIRTSLYEISDVKKFNTEDINYIEAEFNDLMLEDGFTNLFNFPKFKVFLKSITSEAD